MLGTMLDVLGRNMGAFGSYPNGVLLGKLGAD